MRRRPGNPGNSASSSVREGAPKTTIVSTLSGDKPRETAAWRDEDAMDIRLHRHPPEPRPVRRRDAPPPSLDLGVTVDDAIDEPELERFLGRHPLVAVERVADLLRGLTGRLHVEF